METKEPDSRLSVRKEDLEDQELYNLNKVINDLYSKITTARDETDSAVKKFTRSGVIASGSDQSTASIPPPVDGGIPQPQAADWTLNPVVYSAGEDGLQYGFASASISNKPASVDYYSMFIQDYSSGYVNVSATTVTLTSASKEAGNTFENCVAGQIININSVAYTIAANPTAPFESLTLTTSAGTQTNVYFNLNPVDGKWEEIASDAEAGTWQLRPPTGWDVPCCLTASTKDQKTYQPPDGVNYKRLQFAAWGDAPQVTNFSVTVEQQDLSTTDIPSGKFVVNFTKPLDPEYYYASIERLWYVNSSFTGNIGATAIVDVSGNTVTYNSTSSIYSSTFKGQYFNYIQPGDTVYISVGPTLSESDTYTVSEVISNTQIKLTTNPPAGTERVFAQWGRVAGEINPFTQNDYWPLPTSAEYWKFRARSVNHRELANNTTPPTANVTVPASGGITPLTPATQPGSGDWSLNALQYSIDEAGNSSIFVSATITTPSAGADYYSLFWQRTTTPVSGDWIEIAADATAGTWQEWPSAGASYVVAIAANKNTYKLDQPDESIPSYYKTLVIPPWGDADQVTGFSVTVETDNRAGVPSGRFVFNFTKPADPDYYYAQISRIATNASYVPIPGAVYGVVAGEVNPTKQTDWWPLPETAEYWTFKAESVNYRKAVNTTAAPTSNVSVSTSSGITQIAPATITTAAFASTIRPVDLVTTAGIGVTSIVVSSNTGTVTTASNHGLSGGQVAIYGGTGTSAKLNGLYSITVTGLNTFTITTSGVSNGTYSAGLNEVPLPALPSATYPSGATAFVTANTKLYRSSGTAWTIAADGSDIVSNSITAGQIAAGAISTTELFAGEILVGGSSGTPDKPTKFSVRDSGGTEIGFIGDVSSPISFTGGYFKNLLIAPTLSTTATPRIYATSAGSMELVGVNLTVENTGGSTAYPGRVKISTANSSISPIIVENTSGTSSASYMGPYNVGVRSNALNNFYPFVELYRTGTYASIQSYGDPLLNSYVDIRTDATASNSYANFKSVPIQVNGITAIDYFNSAPRGQFGDLSCTTFRLGTTATAGYVLTTDASGIGTWQAAGAAAAAGSTGQVQYNNSGVLAATANFSWNNTNQLLQVASSSTDPNRGIISSQHNDDVQTAGLYLRKSRGSLSSPTVVASGDFIGALTGQAYDGSNYISSSRIAFQIDSTPSTGSIPVRMVFQTGTSGGGTERMRITPSGNVGIGTTSPDALLTVNTIASFGDGAEATPSIAHKGDLNTGFWFPAVDTVAISTDGAERWRVTPAGFLIPADSDTYDIGVLSTNRVRGVYTKIVDTAASGGTGDYIQTRKLQLFDNTGSTTAPSFWDMNVVMSGVGALQNSYFYMRDNSGNKVFQSERISSGSAVDRTFWYTDLLPDTNFGQSLGSISYKWQTIYANQLGDSLNPVTVYGGNSVFSQVTTGTFQFTASPSSGYFLKSDATGYASWATVTSQLSSGAGISITGTATATITNSGVTSITGTSNQVIASASTGGVTLSLPQSIATTNNVTFNSLTLANGASNGILIKDTGGTARTCLTIASDNNLYLDNNDSTYDIYIRPGSGRYTFVDGSYFAPFTNNAISLGYNGQGWSNVYSYAYYANNGSWTAGATGSFTTADSKTVTVQDGIVISIV